MDSAQDAWAAAGPVQPLLPQANTEVMKYIQQVVEVQVAPYKSKIAELADKLKNLKATGPSNTTPKHKPDMPTAPSAHPKTSALKPNRGVLHSAPAPKGPGRATSAPPGISNNKTTKPPTKQKPKVAKALPTQQKQKSVKALPTEAKPKVVEVATAKRHPQQMTTDKYPKSFEATKIRYPELLT
ncbi:hypothetical protein Pst134EA_009477 [Puccinia striiformis f. sp. tritici]|uniref:hypothetical protein n=1 Tax=Puccinia striiformis f. sp. tritici TaxID=168172 RepID=UPI0020082A5E|nr:hypothetical protein Pst134EA_009477 [Puccinia striiformis f. sp. tritici]KAH9468952.1 hypothetical protein Pst134EA_009477 [Puccinia striiformis f. sp. tritici]